MVTIAGDRTCQATLLFPCESLRELCTIVIYSNIYIVCHVCRWFEICRLLNNLNNLNMDLSHFWAGQEPPQEEVQCAENCWNVSCHSIVQVESSCDFCDFYDFYSGCARTLWFAQADDDAPLISMMPDAKVAKTAEPEEEESLPSFAAAAKANLESGWPFIAVNLQIHTWSVFKSNLSRYIKM